MSGIPYDQNLITPEVYGDRRPVIGIVVALLHLEFEKRGLKLIEARSRAIPINEIHELMITDEEAKPGGEANHVSAIAFLEIRQGGVMVVGDQVSVCDRPLGHLAGFDLTHYPNHMNIVVKTESLEDPDIHVNDFIVFQGSHR